MVTGCILSKDDESMEAYPKLYRSMINNLLCVTTSRPNVMQAVGIVAKFQSTPKESRVQVVKRIFRYLKGILDYGLWYPKGEEFTLKAYIDVDWAGCVDDRKSTSGGALFVGSCLVSQLSKKQSSISLSTAEAEYIAATTCCTQILWMKQTLQDIQIDYKQPISILCDNTSAISIFKNLVMHSKLKHIPTKYHFLRDQVENQVVNMEYVPTKEHIANIFKKSLPIDTFQYLRKKNGSRSHLCLRYSIFS